MALGRVTYQALVPVQSAGLIPHLFACLLRRHLNHKEEYEVPAPMFWAYLIS